MNNATVFERLKHSIDNFIEVMHRHGARRGYIWEQLHGLVYTVSHLAPNEIFSSPFDNLARTHAGDICRELEELTLECCSHFESELFTPALIYRLVSFSVDRALNDFYQS